MRNPTTKTITQTSNCGKNLIFTTVELEASEQSKQGELYKPFCKNRQLFCCPPKNTFLGFPRCRPGCDTLRSFLLFVINMCLMVFRLPLHVRLTKRTPSTNHST